MADAPPHDLARQVKIYVCVFIALLVGTLLTAALYYLHVASMAVAIAIALFIASVKGFLVAGFFMHLISERKAIYAIVTVAVIFVAVLMYFTVFARSETPRGTEFYRTPLMTNPETAKPSP